MSDTENAAAESSAPEPAVSDAPADVGHGGKRAGSGAKQGLSPKTMKAAKAMAREMVAELLAEERSKKPTLYDITKAAAEFHYGEAAKAQVVIRTPGSAPEAVAAAKKALEHHIDKASHHAKQALPYELAKLGPQKPVAKKADDDIDWSRINDGDLATLEKIVAAATGVSGTGPNPEPDGNTGRKAKTRH